MDAPSAFGWMAWTPQTAIFWGLIAAMLVGMAVWEYFSPGGSPRRGILGLHTTRGDRLFISLLSSAYLHLLWLGLLDVTLWGATAASVALAVAVFRWV